MLAGTLARDCATAAPGVSLDDQADACGNLREVREALGDREGARRAAEQALSAIEEGSAGAPAATQAIYDWERSQSLLFLGRASEAIALLIERERVLPDSYNPPHYLARIYRATAQWGARPRGDRACLGEGLWASSHWLARRQSRSTEGGRSRLRSPAGARAAARRFRALPAGQKLPEAEAAVEKRLQEP